LIDLLDHAGETGIRNNINFAGCCRLKLIAIDRWCL
jgi:hypothetical protein